MSKKVSMNLREVG